MNLKSFVDDALTINFDNEDFPSCSLEISCNIVTNKTAGGWTARDEAEEGYGTGTYKIKTKDDAFLTVDCTLTV